MRELLHRQSTIVAAVVLTAAVLCSGVSAGPAGTVSPLFVTGTIDIDGERPTSLTFGADGRLFVAHDVGAGPDHSQMRIAALTIDPVTKQVTAVQQIATGLSTVLGLAFDPGASPGAPVLYASRLDPSGTPGFRGAVSRFTGPSWAREDIITGLPDSAPCNNHFTNGLAFADDGRLLIAQGSSTDKGIADPPFSNVDCYAGLPDPDLPNGGYFPETPLSAAILIADVNDPTFDGTMTHSPSGPPTSNNVTLIGGDVEVFAPGTRNPYDLVVHSNGHLYATDNGPNGPYTYTSCNTTGPDNSQNDELNLIEEGNYYGFPNINRGVHLPDPRQCVFRPASATPGLGEDFTPPIAALPSHCSCNGITEYTSDAFGGALQGDLIYAEFQRGSIARASLSSDGRSVESTTRTLNLSFPLDVVVGPDGTIFVAEYTAGRLRYLAPDSDEDGCHDSRELGLNAAAGGQRDPENPYDFYDTNSDRVVNVVDDVISVVAAFGPDGSTNYDADFDRSPLPGAQQRWQMGAPDGAITVLDDVLGAAAQVGHSCA
jgi:glucose/arabinose dehydrogenase